MMKTLTAALLCALFGPEDDYEGLLTEASAKEMQREEAMRGAHEALDAGDDDRAVALAREARRLREEVAALASRARLRLDTLVPELAARLDDDAFEVREEATRALRRLGSAALPGLVRLRRSDLAAEVRCRVDGLLDGITVDGEGRVHQWAGDASASSEYTASDWSARQAIGPPDSSEADSRTAWAAKEADGGLEWLRVKFVLPVQARRLRIHENLAPGGIVRVEAVGEDGRGSPLWEGTDLALPWFEIELRGEVVRDLRIVLDTRKHAGWEEIDAVELVGDPVPEK
jgi:hypothetical protein